MKYSIVMACCNGIEISAKCIKSIYASTKDFELILVDNASNDGTEAYLKDLAAKNTNVKLIRNEEMVSFAKANNQGIALIEGELVCLLNNDTIVNEGWLDRLAEHLKQIPLTNLGMVGPVSSCSNGRQMVGIQDPQAWYAQHKGRWSHTGRLYGWCMLLPKKILDEIGGFDERFINGYEDNDLCLRLQLAGYKMAIACDTYIYHKGQGTLRQMMNTEEYIKSGGLNREVYFDKWADNRAKKLVAVYRTNAGPHLFESLEQTSKFADHIILHFCRAPQSYDTRPQDALKMQGDYMPVILSREEYVKLLQKRFPKIRKVQFYDGIFQEDYERNWLLQEALKLKESGEADWCISLDDDEIYEDKFIERVQKMLSPRNPEVMGYWCQWRTIWETRNGEELWRADSTFGRFSNYRIFRLIKGQEIHSRHPEGHHCGSAPLMAEENLKWTNIRVKHLGYDTPEQRQRKYEFYQKNDHFKNPRDIGNEDYGHLIDRNVTLERWVPDNGISVIMMVRDEEETILACLENMEPIADEFVIVDTGSKDKTVEIIEAFAKHSPVPVKLHHMPWCDNYSIPRNFVKELATKRWILMVDADERFKVEDLSKIELMTETDAEAVIFHVVNYLKATSAGEDAVYASTESVRLYRNIPEFYYTGIIHETVDDALVALKNKRGVNFGRAPVLLHHYGYIRDKERVKGKFEYYTKLNNRQIEVTGGKDPRPFFNLALHWMQEGEDQKALECFQKALTINPHFWHASQQMAALNIRSAKTFLYNVVRDIPETHSFKQEAQQILEYLEQRSFGHQRMEK